MDPSIVVRATGDFRRLNSDLKQTEGAVSQVGRQMKRALTGGALVAGAALTKFAVDSVQSLARIERLNAQTAAAIESTGGAARVSAKHIEDLTGALEAKTATEAESIQTGANFLLTFTNLRNAAGENNKIFDRTVKVMTDMSRAMDSTGAATLDTRTQALQLGKALNNPIKGITALSRVGVSFTKQQQDQIKALVESGKTMDAQKIILRELEKEFGGSGAAFAKTTAGKWELAKHQLGTLGETILEDLMPSLSKLADEATEGLEWLTEKAPEIKAFGKDAVDLGRDIGEVVVPPIVDLAEAARDLLGWFVDLPDPVKEVGIQAGIAALVLPRLAAGAAAVKVSMLGASSAVGGFTARLAQNRAAMSYQTTAMGKAREAVVGFGGAAATAAGIGGMVLLTQSATEASDSMRLLERTAGAALLGFALAGPTGAAVGGVGALATSFDELQSTIEGALGLDGEWVETQEEVEAAASRTNQAIARQKALIEQLRGTIDGWRTSSETAALAHENVLTQLDLLGFSATDLDTTLKALGVSHRDLAKAAAGDKDALQGVIDAYGDVPLDQAKNLVVTQHQLADAIDNSKVATDEALAAERQRFLITQDLSSLIGKLPKKTYTAIEATGIEPTIRGVARVAEQYDLTRGQVTAVIEALGITATVRDVNKVRENLKSVEDTTINLPTGAFGQGLNRGIATLITTGRTGGTNIGGALGAGMNTGLGTWIDPIRQRAISMVSGAIAGARNAAEIFSPSRKTRYIGEMLGEGVVVGMARQAPRARTEGQRLMAGVIAGIDDGAAGIDRSLDRITKAIRKHITGKNDGAREARYLKTLRDEYRALELNGRAQDRITRKLETQRDKLRELRDEYAGYATMIKDAVLATGDVTQLGRLDDGTVSLTALLNEADSAVIGAERFTALMQQLADRGLSESQIQQMLAAGPAAALATAEAIASGGDDAIAQLNAYADRLAATGQSLSKNMADRYYGAGVAAQQGIVAGLESEAAKLDRAAIRLANRLVAAVKKALGIRSPSQEFRDIADDVTGGLTLQLKANDTYVKRSGEILASSLVKGFAQPKLSADVAWANGAAGGGAPFQVEVRLTTEQVSAAQQGKAVLINVSAARSSGARAKAVLGS